MKSVIVDNKISFDEEYTLTRNNYNVLKCPGSSDLYEAVSAHPDMLINKLDKKIIVYNKINISFFNSLKKLDLNIIKSNNILKPKYPYDIALNAINLPNYFIHYLKFTDETLLKEVKNKTLINVKQGYTKCSTALVTDKAIMTSDVGIAKSLNFEKFDVLLLPPGDILLPGLNYGFIGGTCGLLEKGLLAFYGSLENYLYKKEVFDFLKKHKVEPLFLSKGKLIDRGSIIVC